MITKKPKKPSIDEFIAGAPDGVPSTVVMDKASDPNQEIDEGVQITLRLSKEQLAEITAVAKSQGIARAAYIKQATFLKIQSDKK